MVNTPIPILVTQLGIPTTISMLVTNIYNLVDTFFVGKLGTSASGAVGVVFGLMAILQAFGFMFGHGSGSIVSRRLGAGRVEEASRYASTGFLLACISGLIIGVCGLIFIDPLMRLLGSTDTILPFARDYAIFILIAAPFMTGSFALNNLLRYEGLASRAMVGLISGAVLNIFGDMIFMFGFNMGTAGAGLSTALSQIVGFFILLSMYLCGKSQTRISVKNADFRPAVVGDIAATGFPSLLRQGLSSISTMILNQQAKPFGDAAIAAMSSIVNRVNFFAFALGLGLGQGFQPVSSFNYGAKKYSRVRKAFWFTVIVSEVLLAIVGAVIFLNTDAIIRLFRDDPAVTAIGSVALKWQCIALLFQPLAVCANMMFQSCGYRLLASLTAILRSGLYFIPMIMVLSHFLGLTGIQLAQPVTDVLLFVTTIPVLYYFLKKLPPDGEDIPEKHAA
ncbi:MAG: MATE family efflux transporter [Oscillospiraceae bacterium]|nr:MATE family efflux transporter [Oscillospiraceae bacterium]